MLLAFAVGASAGEVSKCLPEFHGAKPTRDALKMAISSGSFDLIRLLWTRLPDEQHSRGDLLAVAAGFHRGEAVKWLFRDSSVFERELFVVLALEARLADGLLEVQGEGVCPWWQRTREVAAKCREAERIEFGEPPPGFWREGGWWEDSSGAVSPIPARSNERWTGTMTESELGRVDKVVGVVLPSGVSSISGDAFNGYAALRSLTIQPGCLEIRDGIVECDDWGDE
jgi:hypothetical protein